MEHVARILPPGVIHRHERRVLRNHQLHQVTTETAVLDKAHIGFPGGNSTRTAADGLEIVIGDPTDSRRCRQYGSGHTVAACHVLRTALGIKLIALECQVAQMDRIEIISALLRTDQFHARIQRSVEPQGIEVVGRHRQEQRNPVVGADLGEGAGRIAGRRHDKHPLLVLVDTGTDAVSLRFLERTGSHVRPDSRVIAVEGNVEIFQPEVRSQPFTFVGHRSLRIFQHSPNRQPVGELVEPVFIGFEFELLFCITSTDQRRTLALGIVQRPPFVRKLPAGSDTLQRVESRGKIFHLLRFNDYDIRDLKSS